MTRKVVITKSIAEQLAALHRRAEQAGSGASFRRAWRIVWNALNEKPLPPDESDDVFGEPLYRTKNPPYLLLNVGCSRPLAIKCAVCEEEVTIAGATIKPVFLLGANLMS